MKALSFVLIFFLLVIACTPEKDNSDAGKPDISTLPRHLQEKIQKTNYLDTAIFANAGATISSISRQKFEETPDSEHKMLVEKFCKESKGYQKGIWEGLNDCSWAVEKYKLANLSEWLVRTNDTLTIKLKNGEKKDFIHDKSNPDQILYFQFKDFLQDINFFVVEAIQNGKCRVSHLVSASDGSSFQINGTLFFSDDQGTFLASSFSKELPMNCTNKIELYKIANSQLEKIWHIPTGDWGVTEARFIHQKEFLMEQSTTGIPPEYKHYAKVGIKMMSDG